MAIQFDKVKITVKQVINPPAESFWVIVGWAPTGPGTCHTLQSTERFKSKEEAVEDMKRRVRALLSEKGVYTRDEDIAWDIQEE